MNTDTQTARRDILEVVMGADPETLERIHAACKTKPRPQRIGTSKQAAAILNTCTRTVFRYAEAGKLRVIRQSARRLRFDLEEVERLASEGVTP